MSMINEVRLIGNIGVLPELFVSENKKNILKVSLATNETYTNKEGNKETKTEWHNLIFFGNKALNVSKYCKKGSKIGITGKITTRVYKDKSDIDRYITEILVNEVIFLDNKS